MGLLSKLSVDPPKLIPIVISGIALTVSLLSYCDNHRSFIINEQINRPVLSVSSKSYEAKRTRTPYSTGVSIRFKVQLKNAGKISVNLFRYEVESFLENRGNDKCLEEPLGEVTAEFPETMLPGLEKKLIGDAFVRDDSESECRTYPMHVQLGIRVFYEDETSGQQYHQYFIEELEIPLKNITQGT